jgi:hypothetical protein
MTPVVSKFQTANAAQYLRKEGLEEP